jgi:hypothetical protein
MYHFIRYSLHGRDSTATCRPLWYPVLQRTRAQWWGREDYQLWTGLSSSLPQSSVKKHLLGLSPVCTTVEPVIDWLIDWLTDWLNTSISHKSIISNAHGAWLMFWPVLRRCHILRWDWPVLPLAHHVPFSLFRTLVHAGFCMFLQSCDLRTQTAGSWKCVVDVLNAYTHWTSVYRLIQRT